MSHSRKRNAVVAILTRGVVSLILLAVGAAIYWFLASTREEPAMSSGAESTPRVMVMAARPVPVQRQWEGFGTARARDSAEVPAQVRAVVLEIPPDVISGENVSEGQLLIHLDDTDFVNELRIAQERIADFDAQIEQLQVELTRWLERLELAQENVQLAQADLARAEAALARDGALEREVDQLRQALVAARRNEIETREQVDRMDPRRNQLLALRRQQVAARDLAQINVDRCRIRSPIDGILQDVKVEVGEAVSVNQSVARVVSLRRIEVPLRLPAGARADLRVGDRVRLVSGGSSDQSWDVVLSRFAPEDDESSRTLTAYADLTQEPDSTDRLAPGTFVRGVARSSAMRDLWVIPRRALQADRIRLIENGMVQSRRVRVAFSVREQFRQLGLTDEQWVVLAESLDAGALVVVNGSRVLHDGTAVEPVLAHLDGDAIDDELASRDGESATLNTERRP